MERFERHIGEALEETVRKYEAMDQIVAAEYAAAERPAGNHLWDALRVSIDRPSDPAADIERPKACSERPARGTRAALRFGWNALAPMHEPRYDS